MSAIEVLKQKTDGMPDEVIITLTAQQAKALLDQLEAERQRADKAELELIKPLPIGELIQRLEGQTYEKWFSKSYLKADQVPIAWLNDAHLARGHIEGEAGEEDAGPGMIPVYREQFISPPKPVSPPVGEIVAWSGTNRNMGITRDIDFRFFRFDVKPGTKLYAVESSSGESNA
jgi:hypothetical protein